MKSVVMVLFASCLMSANCSGVIKAIEHNTKSSSITLERIVNKSTQMTKKGGNEVLKSANYQNGLGHAAMYATRGNAKTSSSTAQTPTRSPISCPNCHELGWVVGADGTVFQCPRCGKLVTLHKSNAIDDSLR